MKTAIQWLEEQINEKMGLEDDDINQLKWFINKAIEKEKKQIGLAYGFGIMHSKNGIMYNDADYYYNLKYKKK